MTAPREVQLQVRPSARYEILDVRALLGDEFQGALQPFRFATYVSHHTTAGYLSPNDLKRLDHRLYRVDPFVDSFRSVFPSGSGYQHDCVDRRTDLSDEQRPMEPRNADSHLTFISSGLTNCATVEHPEGTAERPVYLIELDGVGPSGPRERKTTIVGFNTEREVETFECVLPTTGHEVDSLNLRDPQIGLIEEVADRARRMGLAHGRVDISLVGGDRRAGLTVNEYETFLMRHDLPEVLRNPLHFMMQRARSAWRDPRAVPHKTLDYIAYDVIHLFNRVMDSLNMSHSAFERLIVQAIARPARRVLRLRPDVSFLLSAASGPVVLGKYQSPILIQWLPAPAPNRKLRVSIVQYS